MQIMTGGAGEGRTYGPQASRPAQCPLGAVSVGQAAGWDVHDDVRPEKGGQRDAHHSGIHAQLAIMLGAAVERLARSMALMRVLVNSKKITHQRALEHELCTNERHPTRGEIVRRAASHTPTDSKQGCAGNAMKPAKQEAASDGLPAGRRENMVWSWSTGRRYCALNPFVEGNSLAAGRGRTHRDLSLVTVKVLSTSDWSGESIHTAKLDTGKG